jgi:DNA-binding transcriptional ArsR family regulator
VVQYPAGGTGDPEPVSLEAVELRLDALAHPVRLRLVRTLTRSSHTTSELAFAWDLTAPEVSRHLAVLRRAGLLTTERHGRLRTLLRGPSDPDDAGRGPAGSDAEVAGPEASDGSKKTPPGDPWTGIAELTSTRTASATTHD